FLPEGDILDSITEARNRLWGGIVRDCQAVLATPQPMYGDVPQFRVEDFARNGYWIANALGIEKQFTAAIRAISHDSRALNLNEDQILVEAIHEYAIRGKGHNELKMAGWLWQEFQVCSKDPLALRKLYRSPVYLGKKLLTLADSLKEVFEVEDDFDRKTGQRLWRFNIKDGEAQESGSGGVPGTTTVHVPSGNGR
ncbi:MAG TPA: hypothetical protein VFK47_21475, partial [Ktedonobacteraceae bacterium]|nr:hypothetical protein [Ktedonobacteraceae bacterium]